MTRKDYGLQEKSAMSSDPQRAHEWYLKNRERILVRCKQRYIEKRESILAYNKTRRQKPEHRAHHNLYMRGYKLKNPHRIWSMMTINNHKKEGYAVEFSIDELISFTKNNGSECRYCQQPLSWNNHGVRANSPTLDRINNEKTLSLGNVQILCWRCNLIKGNLPEKNFIDHLSKLMVHFTKDAGETR